MKTNICLLFFFISTLVFAQNKHFSLGLKANGICFGNSKNHNGIRLNIWDKKVNLVNGINFTFKSATKRTNGISLGLLANIDSINNGIKIAGFSNTAIKINGLCVSGLSTVVSGKINGLGINGLLIYADTMSGVFISGLGALGGGNNGGIKVINGISVGMIAFCKKMNGIFLSFNNTCDTLNGVSIGLLYNQSTITKGIQVGVLNKTKDLYGFQFGLWNEALNNRYFKRTPIVNFNLRRKSQRW